MASIKGVPRGPYSVKDGKKLCTGPLHNNDGKGTWVWVDDFYELKRKPSKDRYQYYSSWCRRCMRHHTHVVGTKGNTVGGGRVYVYEIAPFIEVVISHFGRVDLAADYLGVHHTTLERCTGRSRYRQQRFVNKKTAEKIVIGAMNLKREMAA